MSTSKPFRIKKSALLSPVANPTLTLQGEIAFDSAADVIKVRNASSTDALVQAAATQVLTNKTLTGNTAANLISGSGTFVLNTSGTITVPNGTDTLVGKATTDTLTNKTFDADGTGNSITNIENADIKVGAAIARAKLANGTASHVLINDGSGVMSSEAALAKSRGGTGVDNSSVTFPSTGTITTDAGTSTFTNKTFDADATGNSISNIENADIKVGAAIARNKLASGTASHVVINDGSGVMSSEAQLAITRGGTGQSTANAGFNALAPSTTKGDIIVHTGSANVRQAIGSDNQVLVADSSVTNGLKWTTLQQGAKNYITYNNFENNATTGWTEMSATVGVIPSGTPTFSASAAASITIAATSTNPLAGSYSLQMVGTIAQGQGFATDVLTIDREDQAKVLQGSFYYEVASGASNANWSGTSSNTLSVYIYDVTNSTWIQPAGVYNLTQSSGQGFCSFTFQTASSVSQLRVVVWCANTASGSITVNFDDFYLGPQKTVQGPSGPVGEIIATGSNTPPTGFLYCDGSAVSRTAYADLFRAISTTYGVGDGSTTFNLPDLRGVFLRGSGSQTISGTTYTGTLGTKQRDQMQGHHHQLYGGASATSTFGGSTVAAGGSFESLQLGGGAARDNRGKDPITDAVNGTPRTGAETQPANVGVAYHIRYLATYIMSNDTDTRVVALVTNNDNGPTATVTGSYSVLKFTSVDQDTHSGYSTSTGLYTVPVAGWYHVNAGVVINASYTAGQQNLIAIYKNGAELNRGQSMAQASVTQTWATLVSTCVYCNAGDTLGPYVLSSGTTPTVASGSGPANQFTVTRQSGPSTIVASETVAARYTASGATSITSGGTVIVDFATKDFDTHGTVTTGASWKFTAPVSGIYNVAASVAMSNASWSAGNDWSINVYKNGSNHQRVFYYVEQATFANAQPSGSGSVLVKMVAGDYVDIRCTNTGTTANTLTGTNVGVSIHRVGN